MCVEIFTHIKGMQIGKRAFLFESLFASVFGRVADGDLSSPIVYQNADRARVCASEPVLS